MSSSLFPLVSVIIPCLNRAHFLVPTIESVLQQDYLPIECIVVDGGSTDGTIEILKSYGDRIRWISEPDHGHADAINKGWKMSQGEILTWLNADDMWVVPSAVSKAVSYLQDHPEVDVVYGDCSRVDAEGNLVGMSYSHKWDLEYAVEHCDHCIPQPAAFMRRHILEKVGWLDINFISKKDHELWLRIGLVGTIRYLPSLLASERACPGYMAKRGDVTASACIMLTKKFFTLSGVPIRIKMKSRRALSNSYLKGIHYAFTDGSHWRIIFKFAGLAMLTDITNTFNIFRHLEWYIKIAATEGDPSRKVNIGLKLLSLPGRALRKAKKWIREGISPPRIPNLLGDCDIESSWVAAQMPTGPGEALDFGNGGAHLALIAAQRGFHVTVVDLQAVRWPYHHPNLRFVQGDILKLPLPEKDFDLIINCSTVEYVGLIGRYGMIKDEPDGDLIAMARLSELMKPDGVMLLTIPVGRDALFAPICRVYGAQRLPELLKGYIIEQEKFWIKDHQNRWVLTDRETALNFEAIAGSWHPLKNIYALGCFVLRRPQI